MISPFATSITITVALPLSIMGIRVVAKTDWNPTSGIGELSLSHSVFGLEFFQPTPLGVLCSHCHSSGMGSPVIVILASIGGAKSIRWTHSL